MNKPRAKTKEEARTEILTYMYNVADYWANLPGKTAKERCHGTVFSILAMFDGEAAELPAMDIALNPHPKDKAWLKRRGENWFKPHMVINDDRVLHHLYQEIKEKTK